MNEKKRGLRYKPVSVRYTVYILTCVGVFIALCVIDYFMASNIKWVFNGILALAVLAFTIFVSDKKDQERVRQEQYKEQIDVKGEAIPYDKQDNQ